MISFEIFRENKLSRMITFGIFGGNKLSQTAFYGQKIQLILVTYAVNIVPDMCEKWKTTLEKEFKGIHTKYCV